MVVWLHGRMGGDVDKEEWGDEAKGKEMEAWKEKDNETSRREKL